MSEAVDTMVAKVTTAAAALRACLTVMAAAEAPTPLDDEGASILAADWARATEEARAALRQLGEPA